MKSCKKCGATNISRRYVSMNNALEYKCYTCGYSFYGAPLNSKNKNEEQKTMPKLSEWFNVFSIEHIKAFKQLCDTGQWPENFLPENITFDCHWQLQLAIKMGDAWVEQAMAGRIIGIPAAE